MNNLTDYNNEHNEIAANMLHTEPGLLDYRLVEQLNKVANLCLPSKLRSRQVIALLIMQWEETSILAK